MLGTILILFIGVFAGILTGFLGSSGVMAVVPGLILAGYDAHTAIGVSLAVDMFASIVVMITYYRNGRVNLHEGLYIALPAILGAQVGSRLSVYIPEIGLSGGFGILLIISAVIFWSSGTQSSLQALHNSLIVRRIDKYPRATGIGVGIVLGIISGIFGVGGGMMFMFALILLGADLHQAIGTSTMIMAMTTASGALGHMALGNYPYLTMAIASAGTVTSGFITARLANRMNDKTLGRTIAVVFGVLGVMIFVTR